MGPGSAINPLRSAGGGQRRWKWPRWKSNCGGGGGPGGRRVVAPVAVAEARLASAPVARNMPGLPGHGGPVTAVNSVPGGTTIRPEDSSHILGRRARPDLSDAARSAAITFDFVDKTINTRPQVRRIPMGESGIIF